MHPSRIILSDIMEILLSKIIIHYKKTFIFRISKVGRTTVFQKHDLDPAKIIKITKNHVCR